MKTCRLFVGLLLGVFAIVTTEERAYGQTNCRGVQIFSTAKCEGDANSLDEKQLINLINTYRSANNRSSLRVSAPLSMVANRRMLDLRQNLKSLTHSWSNCAYDINEKKTWACVTEAPRTLKSGYQGEGYETLYRTSKGGATPALALEAWKKSRLHNSIILNLENFNDMEWDEVGVAIDGDFAALWFGFPGREREPLKAKGKGLGVTFEEAIDGLSRILSIDRVSTTVESNKWVGVSRDKRIRLEIYGPRTEITEATLSLSAKLEENARLEPKSQLAILTLLENLFPEWDDRVAWLEKSIEVVAADPSSWRVKKVRKKLIELRAGERGFVKLSVTPEGKPKS